MNVRGIREDKSNAVVHIYCTVATTELQRIHDFVCAVANETQSG